MTKKSKKEKAPKKVKKSRTDKAPKKAKKSGSNGTKIQSESYQLCLKHNKTGKIIPCTVATIQ
jgi:hypothetical protein